MDSKMILITGIGGYIGSNLASHLAGDYKIRGLGRDTKFDLVKEGVPQAELINADISDEKSVTEAVSGTDVVIHTAAPLKESFCRENNKKARAAIVYGTDYVAKAAKKEGALLIHISTQAVYGTHKGRELPLSEGDDLLPDTEYGRLKFDAEKVALENNALVLRLAYVYGKGWVVPMQDNFVIGKFIELARQGENLTINGDGTTLVDFIHIKDLSELIAHLIENQPTLPEVYNVGSGNPISLLDIARVIQEKTKRELGKNIKVNTKEVDKKLYSRFLDIKKIKKIMPSFPNTTFNQGIEDLIKNNHG